MTLASWAGDKVRVPHVVRVVEPLRLRHPRLLLIRALLRGLLACTIILPCLAVDAATAAPPPHGAISQLRGKAGCVSSSKGQNCSSARALTNPNAVAVSRDGRNVYVATFSYSIAVFARDERTGVIRQLPGRAGCFETSAARGCARGRVLPGAYDITIDPSQQYVYVSGTSGIVAFRRNPVDGSLTQLPGALGCITYLGAEEGCAPGERPLGDTSIVIASDGRHAYLTDLYGDAIVIYGRDPGTGALARFPGRDGCLSAGISTPPPNCQPARGLGGPGELAFSPDGKHLYVGASVSAAVFSRDPATGRLEQLPGPAGCRSPAPESRDCAVPTLPLGRALALSQGGDNVYFTAGPHITGFGREADGSLREIDPHGCFAAASPPPGCSRGRGLGGQTGDVEVAPDDTTVYVTTSTFTAGGQDKDRSALTAFRRDPTSGSLVQLPESSGCLSQAFERTCGRARGIADATDVAVSPDNRHIYVAGWASNAIATFAICRPAQSACLRPHITNRGRPTVRLRGVPRRCVSRRVVVRATAEAPNGLSALRVRVDRRVPLRLRLGSRDQGVTKRSSLRLGVPARRLRPGRHSIVVTAVDRAGLVARRASAFRPCATAGAALPRRPGS
jgi:DNA-binding beta-propeller fold protein YncE